MQNLSINSWYWRFENRELADPDLVVSLTLSVCDSCQLSYPNPKLQLLLGEIITNAIDHGVLGLGSMLKDGPDGFDRYIADRNKRLASLLDEQDVGWVSVTVEPCANGMIQIMVQDSGLGFDHESIAHRSDTTDLSLYGRGLMIIKNLCESMQHSENGDCIVVEFDPHTKVNDAVALKGNYSKPAVAGS